MKKYWKVVAIAVAAYFTFGLALGAMAPAAGTVAAGTGAAATGGGVMTATAAAGTGTAAAATGAAAGAAATAAGIETVTVTAAAAGGGISAAGAAGAIAGGAAAANAGGAQAAKPAVPAQSQQQPPPQQQASPSLMDKAKTGWKEMSFGDKLLLAKAGVDVAAAAAAPSPEEEAAAAAKWQGAFYGFDAKGADQFVKQQGQATKIQQAPSTGGGGRQIVPTSSPMTPPGQDQQPGQALQAQRPQLASAQQQAPEQPPPEAEQVTNVGGNRDLFAQRAKGVRYLV